MRHSARSIIASAAAFLCAAAPGLAQTPSELCADAPKVGPGAFEYTFAGLNNDGSSPCIGAPVLADRWVRYRPLTSGFVTVTMSGPGTPILSAHSGCPGTTANLVQCHSGSAGIPAELGFPVIAATTYVIRLANAAGLQGPWTVTIAGPPVAGGFTYQGRLKQSGSPMNTPVDLRFSLWTLPTSGFQDGGTDTHLGVPVDDGLFAVQVNNSGQFGWGSFYPESEGRWLQIEVRSPAGAGAYTTLTPRHEIRAAPLASRALTAVNLSTFDGDVAVVVGEEDNVGIGVKEPLAPLHVAQMGGIMIGQEDMSGDHTAARFRLTQPFDGATVIESIKSAGTAWGDLILNPSGGNVGIGTMTPGFTLAVNGTAAKPGGGAWSVLSDGRLKKNVATLTGALDRVLRLRGVTFEYNEEGLRTDLAQPGVHTGLIAQEVARVFPEWVGESPDGHKFITEQGVTALLVEALRDLRREKEAEIADLRERLERLESAAERR